MRGYDAAAALRVGKLVGYRAEEEPLVDDALHV